MNSYRQHIWGLVQELLTPYGPWPTALDFGAGDGWFAHLFQDSGLVERVCALDVQRRAQCHVEPQLYDGGPLPYGDRSFPLVYAMDVLHHCDDPSASLGELCRCSARYLLIKDHTSRTALDRAVLGLLDEVGNRRFGVRSPRHYQHDWQWWEQIAAAGFEPLAHLHPAPCHLGWLGRATNRLQAIGLWHRA